MRGGRKDGTKTSKQHTRPSLAGGLDAQDLPVYFLGASSLSIDSWRAYYPEL